MKQMDNHSKEENFQNFETLRGADFHVKMARKNKGSIIQVQQ